MAEFPVALLSDSASPGQKTIEFEDTIHDWESGEVIARRVSITGSDKFGLPTAKDEEVLLALLQLTKLANDFTCPEVRFVKRQVIEILGWQNRGWAYDRVEESLHRWKGVSIHYWNAWRNKATGSWCDSAAIGVIDYFTLSDGRRKRAGENCEGWSRFSWNKLFFESFEAGYLKQLDFETYRRLQRPAAKRALRFLDKRFYHSRCWEFDLRQFACEKLGFSRAYTTGQLKERLRPALGELEEVGLIEPVTYRKERPKVWTIGITRKSTDALPEVNVSQPVSNDALASALIQRRVAAHTAHELIDAFPASRVQEKLSLFDWLTARKDKRISKNPPGWLATAIRKDFPPPRDYLRALAPVIARRKAPETSPRKTVSDEQNPTIRAVEDYLGSQTEQELAALELEALARADPAIADGYRRSQATGGQTYAAYRRMLLEREARRLVLGDNERRKFAS